MNKNRIIIKKETSNLSKKHKKKNGKVIAECILQTADEKNRNGRYYSKELFSQLRDHRTLELLEKSNKSSK